MTRRGLTLIETVLSVVVVSLLFAGALNAAGTAAATTALANDHQLAAELCQSLMAEITQQTYYDPQTGLNGLGPGVGEANGLDRTGFDDVDDYNGWTSSPPEYRNGSVIPGTAGLTRSVTVSKYTSSTGANLFKAIGEVKIVTIEVSRAKRTLYTLTAVRTPDWDTRGIQR